MTNQDQQAHARALESHRENVIALRLIARPLIGKTKGSIVETDPAGPWTAARVCTLGALVDTLISQLDGDGPIDIEGKAKLSETLWKIALMAETSTHGIGEIAKRQAPSKQAGNARDKKRSKDEPRKEHLDFAIRKVAKARKLELVASDKFAESILDDVRRECTAGSASWPSKRTVRRGIARIIGADFRAILKSAAKVKVHT
jgi:hypothetical protein